MAQLMITGFGIGFPTVISAWCRKKGGGRFILPAPVQRHPGLFLFLNMNATLH